MILYCEVLQLKYYICESCLFQFERSSDCDKCPDCGKECVRKASDQEKEAYFKLKEEFK